MREAIEFGMDANVQSVAQFRQITPKDAKEMLKYNEQNRRLDPETVSKYARDMKNGEWRTELAAPIVFDEDGKLREGQHRLHAILDSGTPQIFLVVGNNPADAALIQGRVKQRNAYDQCIMAGVIDTKSRPKDFSIARHMLGVLGRQNPSDMELADFYHTYPEMFNFLQDTFGNTSKQGVSVAALQSAVGVAVYYENSSRLKDFVDVLLSGIACGREDAGAVRVRDWITRTDAGGNSSRQMEVYIKSQRGVKAFCDRYPLKVLHQPQEATYELPERELKAFTAASDNCE